jgi:predicted dehydrogenase/nucleoside-diphosphate-sugar epimerase
MVVKTAPTIESPSSAAKGHATSIRQPVLPLRFAIVGCGAVAEQLHLPILAGHEQVRLTALVDQNLDRARRLAKAYDIKSVCEDLRHLDAKQIDAVIIATPPAHHAAATIELMKRGIHVLVEKPMATNYADAAEMVEVARQQRTVLSVGVYRRLYASLQFLKSLVAAEHLGPILSVDLEGGAVYGWSAATLGNMRKEFAGGGVLMDMAPHYFDQLIYLFPGPADVLKYQDNSLGGIESDCLARLQLIHRGEPIEARIELSRTRALRNNLQIKCENGTLEWDFGDRFQVAIRPSNSKLPDPATEEPREYKLLAGWANERESPWHDAMRAQIDDFVDSIVGGHDPQLSGHSTMASMALIDQCYRQRQQLPEPWRESKIAPHSASTSHGSPRVLITGASGFIGCRVAEMLVERGYLVRALIHEPGHASRLARLDAEMVQGDICDSLVVQRTLTDCDFVVHCAVGTSYGDKKRIQAVTVGGTKTLVRAAKACGRIRRLVHLSSIAVYGNRVRGTIDESTPLAPSNTEHYGWTKFLAERAVLDGADEQLPVTILRPGCVYGPFGATFTARPLTYLKQNRLVLAGSADAPSNTIFVDHLAEMIIRGLERDDAQNREIFTAADDDGLTWGEFYGYFADALGLKIRWESTTDSTQPKPRRVGSVRAAAQLLTSPESKQLGKRFLATPIWGAAPYWLIQHMPGLENGLRRMFGSNRGTVYLREVDSANQDIVRITPMNGQISCAHARQALGYQPRYTRNEALARTLEWAKYARIV